MTDTVFYPLFKEGDFRDEGYNLNDNAKTRRINLNKSIARVKKEDNLNECDAVMRVARKLRSAANKQINTHNWAYEVMGADASWAFEKARKCKK